MAYEPTEPNVGQSKTAVLASIRDNADDHEARIVVHEGYLNQAVKTTSDVVHNSIQLSAGTSADEVSTDGTMAGNSDDAIPTEKAVVTYVAASTSASVGNADYLGKDINPLLNPLAI